MDARKTTTADVPINGPRAKRIACALAMLHYWLGKTDQRRSCTRYSDLYSWLAVSQNLYYLLEKHMSFLPPDACPSCAPEQCVLIATS